MIRTGARPAVSQPELDLLLERIEELEFTLKELKLLAVDVAAGRTGDDDVPVSELYEYGESELVGCIVAQHKLIAQAYAKIPNASL